MCLPDSRLHNCERFGQLQGVGAAETLQSSHCPNGKLTFCSLVAGRWCLCRGWHSVNCELPDLLQHSFPSTCQPRLQTSHRNSRFAHCLQGGGVFVQGGTVSIVNSQIYSNTASQVRASHTCKLPIAPMGDSRFAHCLQGGGVAVVRTQIFKSSHRPDGRLTFCSLFAGWWCWYSCRWTLGVNRELPDLLQHS
jgi:hypothetical protein